MKKNGNIMKVKNTRNSSIELLRIFAGMGVIILHYNSAGGAFAQVTNNSLNQFWLYFSQTISNCAVDLFVIISAFFLSGSNKRDVNKVINLWLQFTVFKFGAYILQIVAGKPITTKGIVYALLPTNYFLILYCVVYVISPFFNILINQISDIVYRRLIVLLVILFSIWNMVVNYIGCFLDEDVNAMSTVGVRGNQAGLTVINFILLYFVGAYIKRIYENVSLRTSLLFCIISIVIMYVMAIIEKKMWGTDAPIIRHYDNIFVILLSAGLLLIALKISFNSTIVNELAKATFTCLLINDVILGVARISLFVNRVLWVLVLHQLLTAIGGLIAAYIVYRFYSLLAKPILRFISPLVYKINAYISVEENGK